MKNRNLFAITLSLLAISASILLPYGNVSAVNTTTGGQALEIAPPVVTLSADPGQTLKTKINLRNISSDTLYVTNQINDFVASGEDGTPRVILDSEEVSPYSIKDWIDPVSELSLKPKQIENLAVTIHVPTTASPGGYYGVIRFTSTPEEMKTTGVSLSASLGALIILKVNGTAVENLSIEEFSVNKDGRGGSLFEFPPLNFVARIKNDGNIDQQPTGQVVITDMFSNTVAAVNVNLEGSRILPQSIRKFEQALNETQLGERRLFGKYTATLNMKYGSEGKTMTKSITFWVIPYTLILLVVLGLVAGFFGLRYGIKRYNDFIRGQVSKPAKKKRK